MSAIEQELHAAVEAAIRNGYSPAAFIEAAQYEWESVLRDKRTRDEREFVALLKGNT